MDKSALETFLEEPYKFCQPFLEEAERNRQSLDKIDQFNLDFYEGRDPELEKRAKDPEVRRSSLYVPILSTAIDTNVADAVASVNSSEAPVTIRPRLTEHEWLAYRDRHYANDETYKAMEYAELVERAMAIEVMLNKQLRASKYLPFGFEEHVRGAEIFRSPSFVKVCWRSKKKLVPFIVPKSPIKTFTETIFGAGPQKIGWKAEEYGGPYVEWISPLDCAYQPYISLHDFHESATFFGHIIYRTKDELLAGATDYGYGADLINEHFTRNEHRVTNRAPDTGKDELQKRLTTERGQGQYWDDFKEDKALLIEVYLCFPAENQPYRMVTLLGGDTPINKNKSYKMPYLGTGIPFIPLGSNTTPGMMEGLSSVDIGCGHQRTYSDMHNAFFDITTYTCFPVFKNRTGNMISGKPVWRGGAIFNFSDPEEFTQLTAITPNNIDLQQAAITIKSNLNEALNANEDRRGITGNPYEKATSAKLQSIGASRRAVPKNARYGAAIAKVSELMVSLNQQFSDNPDQWTVPGGVMYDVPAFTYGYDDETRKQDHLLMLQTIGQSPRYAIPEGQLKLLAIETGLIKLIMKEAASDKYLTADQYRAGIKAQVEVMQAQEEKLKAEGNLAGTEGKPTNGSESKTVQ